MELVEGAVNEVIHQNAAVCRRESPERLTDTQAALRFFKRFRQAVRLAIFGEIRIIEGFESDSPSLPVVLYCGMFSNAVEPRIRRRFSAKAGALGRSTFGTNCRQIAL
jgi:hypothetical protein